MRHLQIFALVASFAVVMSYQACGPIGTPIGEGAFDSSSLGIVVPDVNFTLTPSDLSNQNSARFEFQLSYSGSNSGSGSGYVECQLDSSAPFICESPLVLNGLSDGEHNLSITPVSGSPSSSTLNAPKGAAKGKRWRVDTTAPVVTLLSYPPSLTSLTSASFSFSATDASSSLASIECSLDSATFAACSSPRAYSNLNVGSHTFRVRASDIAGNVSTPVSYTWNISTSGPSLSITAAPTSPTNSSSASFSFSATPAQGTTITAYNCSLDGAAYAACTSPRAYSGLSSGTHTFRVTARDSLGNTSQAAQHQWVVDTVAPTVAFTAQPASLINVNTASFSFAASDSGVGVQATECSLDNAAFAACTSPRSLVGLPQGARNFRVRARDRAGNVSSIASHNFTVDSVRPTVTLTSTPPATSTSTSASMAFTATDASPSSGITSVQCQLDSNAYANCSNSVSYSNLSVATHIVRVRARDAAANETIASYSFTVEAAAPPPPPTEPPPPPAPADGTCPTPSTRRILYVNASTGNDATTYAANSATAPWRSLGRAVWGSTSNSSPNASQAAQAGDLVLVAAGTYNTNAVTDTRFTPIYNPVNSGTASAPITFRASGNVYLRSNDSSGRQPIIGAYGKSHIVWDGFIIDESYIPTRADTGPVVVWASQNVAIINNNIIGNGTGWNDNHNGVRIEQSNYTLVRNNRISNFRGGQNDAGVMTYDSNDSIIEGNEIYNNGAAVFIKGVHTGFTQRRSIIRKNLVYGHTSAGIRVLGSEDAQVYQNIVINNSESGLWAGFADSTRSRFFNNTLFNNGRAITAQGSQLIDVLFQNNIIANNQNGVYSWDPANPSQHDVRFDRNIYYGNATHATYEGVGSISYASWRSTYGLDANSLNTNPLFVNAGARDFRLQSGSPALTLGRDSLDLNRNGNTTEAIPAGAYITGNEVIGSSAAVCR